VIRILHLEDNPHDAELLRATLDAAGLNCQIVRVETEEAFRNALNNGFDLILSDFTLPSYDGKQALELAKKRMPNIPFIFVSGTIGEEVAIESLVGGATDYVLKHRFGRLVPAVQRALKETADRKARREAERQLQNTLEHLRSLFDNLDDVFFSFDPRTNELLHISPACEQVYGLPPQAFFESPQFWKRVATTADLPVIESAQSRLEAGQNVSCEYRISKPDATTRWVHARMKPVHDAEGHMIRVDGIISDISERKELEAQFLRAQRLENLGSLAGGIAHDLNNVLAPIVMGIQLLRDRHKDASTISTLGTLESCAKRGANLVKQILMFARGVEGRRVPVDPGRLIVDLERILRRTFAKSIRIVLEVVPDLWTVSADATQLEQVLMNLCVNARDAMPGGGTLTIAAHNQIHDGAHVVIEVRDTGEGIPPENLDKIFDPFFTTKAAGAGTGLGLSTVSAIIKSHGGFVTVDSTLSQGTTFRMYLPALPAGVQKEPAKTSGAFPAGKGELILVVDDEAAIRDLARTILENYGYRVIIAADGVEGVAEYSKHQKDIDLVLTDLDMPKIDGPHLIRLIERMNPDVRVIAVSGLMGQDTFEDKTTGKPRPVLQKPFPPAQLLQTLRKVLDA